MLKRYVALAGFLLLSLSAFAQETSEKKTGRPDIPGTFVVDLGLNRMSDKPLGLDYGLWGSRTLNLYYQYDMRIGNSKFSFHPGIGLGNERFKMLSFQKYLPSDTVTRSNPTLIYDANGNTTFVEASRFIYDGDTLGTPDWSLTYETRKSMLVLSYLDIPLELRFSVKPDDPARSFKIGVGARFGYLIGSHTKLKYREDGEKKIMKVRDDFNLNPIRYGGFVKIYFGNFNMFTYVNLSTLFRDGRGPGGTDATVYTIGLSLSSF